MTSSSSVRSPQPDAAPLVLTHKWPSSVIEPVEVADALANPTAADAPAFHVVAPALPCFGPSGRPVTPGWSVDRTAGPRAVFMARLDHERFSAAGGDWGGRVTTAPAVRHPERVEAIHTFTPYADVPAEDGDLGERERISLQETRDFWNRGGSHSLEQSTRHRVSPTPSATLRSVNWPGSPRSYTTGPITAATWK